MPTRIPPRLREEFGYVVRSVLAEPRRWVLLVVCADADPATPRAFHMASLDTEDAHPAQITQLPPGTVGFIHDLYRRGAARAGAGPCPVGRHAGRAHRAGARRAPTRPARHLAHLPAH